MKTISLSKKDIYNGNLILVNHTHPIVKKYWKNRSCVPVDIKYPEILMEFTAATVLAHIIDDLDAKDEIVPVSGYRSKKEQEKIYADSLRENGEEFTKKYVALPNHSEHQTGLAMDLAKGQEEINFIYPEFPYDGIYNEFRKIAPEYGFIQRYNEGKEDITGIAHEPWHFRYIGYPHSKIMYKRGLCLEEYIEKIKKYPFGERHINIHEDNQCMEISFVPVPLTKEKLIHLPEHRLYQISGNNVDGCIISLWQ